MKKLLSSLFLLLVMLSTSNAAKAMRYEEAINQSKPLAILIYAPWADGYQNSLQAFNQMEQRYSTKYNFVRMNIATDEAKAYNQKFYIYPNLPYVILCRERGKVSRYLKSDCVNDSACFANRLDMFNN